MAEVDAAIRRYIESDIALSARDISAAAASRDWFLTRLQNEVAARWNGPELHGSEPFVRFGSYFKGTKVGDVDEFDILVVIDSNTGIFSSGGAVVGHGEGTAAPNHKYDPHFLKSDGSGVSPSKLLEWLRAIVAEIARSYGGEAPVRDGQAITARVASHDLSIDLVPAGMFTRASDGSTFYNIPKGDAGDGWTLTSPRQDIDLLDTIAAGKDDLRNVIRIAKRIRDTYGLKIPSFAIETSIIRYAQGTNWTEYVSLEIVYGLRHLAREIASGQVADPFQPDNNLIADVLDLAGRARLFTLMADYVESLRKPNTLSADEMYDAVRDAFEAKVRAAA